MPATTLQRRLPNALTVLRLALAAGFFVLVALYDYPGEAWLLNLAASVFVLAALTDAIDGHLARCWDVISVFGRVMDPVADKVLVIGALAFLAGPGFLMIAPPETGELQRGLMAHIASEDARILVTGVYPWMVVVILTRELLVTSIRSVLEASGIAFPAIGAGKLKMVLQSIVTPVVLVLVANFDPMTMAWSAWLRDSLVYLTVIVTVVSGLPYVTLAAKAIKTGAATACDDAEVTS